MAISMEGTVTAQSLQNDIRVHVMLTLLPSKKQCFEDANWVQFFAQKTTNSVRNLKQFALLSKLHLLTFTLVLNVDENQA